MRARQHITTSRRIPTKVVVAATAVLALAAGATAVGAMSAKGSREFAQGARGMTGATETGDFFAASLAVGDFDGDGNGDVLAGAPYENLGAKRDAGVIHVVFGNNRGLDADTDTSIHQNSPNVAGKAQARDLFGSAVVVGDFDNDGFDDAVIGAPGKKVGTKKGAGAITVLYGSRAGLRGQRSKSFTPGSSGTAGSPQLHGAFGASLASGDFNRDGFDDVAIGAPGAGGRSLDSAGLVHIMYGGRRGITASGDHQIIQGAGGVAGERMAGDEFGASLAAGDFDGDGDDDLAVGVPGDATGGVPGAGAVELFVGAKSGLVAASGRLVTQNDSGLRGRAEMDDRFGASLASADFDGNGRDDLAVGSPGEAKKSRVAAGQVHVLYGTRSGLTDNRSRAFDQGTKGIKSRPEAGDEFGLTLAAGDFNGNGRMDLAIGAPGEGFKTKTGAGVVHVLYGASSGLNASRHQWFRPGSKGIPGESQPNAGFGRALAAGDVDGDGRADLLGGSPGRQVGRTASAGALTLIFG